MNPFDAFLAGLVPLSIAAVVAYVGHRLRCAPAAAWAAGVASGYLTGQFLLAGRAGFHAAAASFLQPLEAVHWLPGAVLLALGITVLASHSSTATRRLAPLLAVALAIGLPLRLLAGSTLVTQRWGMAEKLAYSSLLAAVLAGTWFLLASPADKDHPRLRPLLLVIVSLVSAVVVALSGVLVYGKLCGMAAAAVAGALVGSLIYSRPAPGASGLAGVVVCSLGSLILLSCFYAELTTLNAVLLFAAVAVAGGPTPAFLARRPSWQQISLRVALCLLPLAVALAFAVSAARASMSASPYAV